MIDISKLKSRLNSLTNTNNKTQLIWKPKPGKQVVKSEPDSFIEFPVEGLDIEIKFGYVKKPNGNAKFRTGGAMYQIKKESQGESYMKLPSLEIPEKILKEINKTIIGKMEIEVLITPTFEPKDIDDLIDDLRDSITHEMLHLI